MTGPFAGYFEGTQQKEKDPFADYFATTKQQATDHAQSFSDYLSNVSKNWISQGAAKTAINAVRMLDPLSQSRIIQDPSVKIAASDLLHTFDHVLDYNTGNPLQTAAKLGTDLGGSQSGVSAGGLAQGAIKPLTDVMELSSGLQLTQDDTRVLTPEEKASRIKSTAGFIAASAVAGPLSEAMGGTPIGGIGQKLLFGAKVGAGAGAVYGGVAAANDKDQLAQIISGTIMGAGFGTLGSAWEALHGSPKIVEGAADLNYSLPEVQRGIKASLDKSAEQIAQIRQMQVEGNSTASTIKMAQALATNDDVAAALIEGKIGLEKGDVHIVPGVNPGTLAFLDKKLPTGYRSVIHVDKEGTGHLLVYDESLPIDERFFGRNGMIENQSVSYNGQDHWSVKNVLKSGEVTIQNLNDPNTVINVPRDDVRMLSNVEINNPLAGTQVSGVVYHGTGNVYDVPDPTKFDPEGLYGPGYYTTRDPSIAATPGYTKINSQEYTAKPKITGQDLIKHQHELEQENGVFDAYTSDTIDRAAYALDQGHLHSNDVTELVRMQPSFKQFFDATPKKQSNVRVQKLNLKNRFDIEKFYTEKELNDILDKLEKSNPDINFNSVRGSVKVDLDYFKFKGDNPEVKGENIYSMLQAARGNKVNNLGFLTKAQVNLALQKAGFDGITHEGGIQGGPKHEVNIVFDPKNVLPPNTEATIPVSLTDRDAAINNLYSEWKSNLETQAPKQPQEPGVVDESEPASIFDKVPDLHNVDLQKNLNQFLGKKGFQGDDLTSLKRELQLKLSEEAGARYLEPEEIAIIKGVKSAVPEAEGKLKTIQELRRIAKSNGFDITDGGSGRVIVREMDKNGSGKILSGFDNQQDAIKWMNKTGQKDGIKLDDNGFLDTGPGKGGLPPIPPETDVGYPTDNPYNFAASKANKGEGLLQLANNAAWMTRYRDFLLKIDTDYGTNLASIHDNISQKKNIRNARWQPYAEELANLQKSISKLTPAQRERISEHMETMTPAEIVHTGMSRPMTATEIKFATDLSRSGADIDRIFSFRRDKVSNLDREFPEDQRQADPKVEAEYQQRLFESKQAFGIDDLHQKYVDMFDQVESMRKDDAAIGPIVRLARAISNNHLNKSEFAAKNKMSLEEVMTSNKLSDMYARLAQVFGINPKSMLGSFMTHARLYDNDIGRATSDFSGDVKTRDFYAKLSRTGELSAIEKDALKAMMRYQKSGFDVQSGFADAVAQGKNSLKQELLKIADSGTRQKVNQVVSRYFDDVQGFPGATDKAAQEVANKFGKMIGKEINVNAWTNAMTSTMAAGGLGARPMLGIGHFGISTLLSIAERSHGYTARMLANGAEALTKPEILQDLQDRGVMSGLSPIATISASEYAGTARGVIRKGQDALFKASLLPTVYDGMAAGHYLTTSGDATAALTKFGRKEMTWAEVKKQTFLDRYDAPVAQRFTDMVKDQKYSDASEYLGRQAIEDMVGTYGAGNHPYLWGSNLGKIAGQFGNFAMFVRGSITRTLSRGTVAQRIGSFTKLAAYTAAIGEISDWTGLQLNRISPLHAMAWMGGPAIGMIQDAVNAVRATGYTQDAAQRRLKKLIPIDGDGNFHPSLFLPGSYAIDGLIHAADDFSNNPVLGIGEAIGFHKTAPQKTEF